MIFVFFSLTFIHIKRFNYWCISAAFAIQVFIFLFNSIGFALINFWSISIVAVFCNGFSRSDLSLCFFLYFSFLPQTFYLLCLFVSVTITTVPVTITTRSFGNLWPSLFGASQASISVSPWLVRMYSHSPFATSLRTTTDACRWWLSCWGQCWWWWTFSLSIHSLTFASLVQSSTIHLHQYIQCISIGSQFAY